MIDPVSLNLEKNELPMYKRGQGQPRLTLFFTFNNWQVNLEPVFIVPNHLNILSTANNAKPTQTIFLIQKTMLKLVYKDDKKAKNVYSSIIECFCFHIVILS